METTTELFYTATLENASGLPDAQRQQAEKRYCKALEKALGDSAKVARACRAWQTAADSEEASIDRETATLATLWLKAADLARQAGMRDLGEDSSVYFDLRLH